MFSGIIESLGQISAADFTDGKLMLRVATGFGDLTMGESVAINGVCLTVVEYDAAGSALFYASPETLSRTNFGDLTSGGLVNLERAVSLSTRLSGHMVQGHVDGLATLDSIMPEAGAYKIALTLPANLARYAVEKGSIALDGISLTLNTLQDLPSGDCTVGLTIIPHTWAHTNLKTRKIGDLINVESDVFAKYVERLCKP
jgi:riboflavin synthase